MQVSTLFGVDFLFSLVHKRAKMLTPHLLVRIQGLVYPYWSNRQSMTPLGRGFVSPLCEMQNLCIQASKHFVRSMM